jgi:hypothetical protein
MTRCVERRNWLAALDTFKFCGQHWMFLVHTHISSTAWPRIQYTRKCGAQGTYQEELDWRRKARVVPDALDALELAGYLCIDKLSEGSGGFV